MGLLVGRAQALVVFLLFVSTLFSLPQAARSDDGSLPQHPYVTEYLTHLNVVETSFDPAEIRSSISFLIQNPTREFYDVTYRRLERMPDVAEILEIPDLNDVVRELLGCIRALGSYDDLDMLVDILSWAESARLSRETMTFFEFTLGHLSNIQTPKNLRTVAKLNEAMLGAESTGTSLVPARSSLRTTDPMMAAHNAALHEIAKFYKYMRDRVIGQEQVLRSMETLFLKDEMNEGSRRRPEVFYLMGLPGNGKDTIAETYVDAIWKRDGAHREHMFRINIRDKNEAWSYFGSGKGYVGSSDLPAFLKFLVLHSGGRYQLAMEPDPLGRGERQVIVRNPSWKPDAGNILLGPHRAVVFVNEAHNIPKGVKDNILKQAIERGIFPVTNPGNSSLAVSELEIPVTFIFASNEGIELLEPRNANGTRVGRPLSYEALYENYLRVHNDSEVLRNAILKHNGGINDSRGPDAPGTSEEFLNRIPPQRLFMLEPFSPEQLRQLARMAIQEMIVSLKTASGRLGSYTIEVSDEMIDFIVDYNNIASENARPLRGRLESFVFEPIYDALRRGRIRATGRPHTIRVGLNEYARGARGASFVIDPDTDSSYSFTRLIRRTIKDVTLRPLSADRIDQLLEMRGQMLENVFGVEHIVDRLFESALVSESEARNSGTSSRKATILAFLGLTSTGKTETAKQYVKARYGEDARPVIIDFNNIRSLESLSAQILGSYDERKNPIPSLFMKEYDRANGKITFIFDEAANSPRELLKGLYEILREASPSNFTDGKARPMNNVTIILTGNAGEQIYSQIPSGLSRDVRERAMNEVFRIFLQDEEMQHQVMSETFPEALLARIGQNIFHFGPLRNKAKRQIAQLKLLKGLRSLRPTSSERGWHIGFAEEADLFRLFDMIELEGFRLKEQGASIDRIVNEYIIDKIKARLLIEKVPSGSQILLEVSDPVETIDHGVRYQSRTINLIDTFGRTFELNIQTGQNPRGVAYRDVDRVLVAYHEAGHEIVSQVYLGDSIEATYLSIIQGVALIGNRFVPYEGVRRGELITDVTPTRGAILRHAAVMTAGYVAQQLVTLGGRHDAGKSNDMLRATSMIQNSILRHGLSERWGRRAVPEGQSNDQYIATLTAQDRELFNQLVQEWLDEAEELAQMALMANFDRLFVTLSKEISNRGHLHAEEIRQVYSDTGVITEHGNPEFSSRVDQIRELLNYVDAAVERSGPAFHQHFREDNYSFTMAERAYGWLARRSSGWLARWNPLFQSDWNDLDPTLRMVAASRIAHHVNTLSRDARLAASELMPERVADIDAIMAEQRRQVTEPVTQLDQFQIGLQHESQAESEDQMIPQAEVVPDDGVELPQITEEIEVSDPVSEVESTTPPADEAEVLPVQEAQGPLMCRDLF